MAWSPGTLSVAADLTFVALDYHIRSGALLQTMQERPLLKFMQSIKETFPSGKTNVKRNVQGAVMGDTAGFFAGYTGDEALSFNRAENVLNVTYPWKEVHAGLVISQTELKQDGITLTDGERNISDHASQLTRLVAIFKNRLDDFSESWSRAMNTMLWLDGSQDSKQTPGIKSILQDDPTLGTVGGLSQVSYTWWRSRVNLSLTPSAENQTLSKFLRNEILQLTRFGGKPNKALCGSAFWDALMQEVEKKGQYTTTGFAGKTTDIGIGQNQIAIQGIGTFEYDPTLDTMGESKRCYILDSRALRYQPMEGEENKAIDPSRPYQYLVLLKSMTNTAALTCDRLNGMAIYGVE